MSRARPVPDSRGAADSNARLRLSANFPISSSASPPSPGSAFVVSSSPDTPSGKVPAGATFSPAGGSEPPASGSGSMDPTPARGGDASTVCCTTVSICLAKALNDPSGRSRPLSRPVAPPASETGSSCWSGARLWPGVSGRPSWSPPEAGSPAWAAEAGPRPASPPRSGDEPASRRTVEDPKNGSNGKAWLYLWTAPRTSSANEST